MTHALQLLTRYAFDEMKLHRLEANIQPGNFPSIALVKRCGFQLEGFSPKYLKVFGEWRDHQRWALLADTPAAMLSSGIEWNWADFTTKTGLSESAIKELHRALLRGDGVMAQFDHPELGGLGQWSRGGMIMIGDMFNHALAARVAAACELLSKSDLTEAVKSIARAEASTPRWWPDGLGEPSMSAGQDQLRYAFFPATHRLAVLAAGRVDVYDLRGISFTGVGVQSGRIVVQSAGGSKPLEAFPILQS